MAHRAAAAGSGAASLPPLAGRPALVRNGMLRTALVVGEAVAADQLTASAQRRAMGGQGAFTAAVAVLAAALRAAALSTEMAAMARKASLSSLILLAAPMS